MCYPATCKTCGKTTWAGCGQHVAEVRRTVRASDWCNGHAPDEKQQASGGLFGWLFGR